MHWENIIEVDIYGRKRRYRVETSENPKIGINKKQYSVFVNEIDQEDNIVDRFDFFIDIDNNILQTPISDSNQPITEILEVMENLIAKGHENW